MIELSPEDRELSGTYGPPAPFSDYTRGQALTYHVVGSGAVASGIILWVAAADMVGSQRISLRYIVASDQARPDQPLPGLDIVFPSEVIQDCSL